MRMVVRAAVVLAVLLLATLAMGRFWLGQHLDEYRPQIEHKLSQEAALNVHIAQLAVEWNVLLPRFALRGLRVQDRTGKVDFSLSEVSARPGVLSLLIGRLDFVQLLIRQPELQVQRRADGRLLVAGVLLPGASDAPGSPFVDWLLNQKDIRIEDGHLHWQDLAAGTAPLALPHVNLHLQSHGAQHNLELTADAPDGLARGLTVRADVHAVDSMHLADWRGSVGLRADFVDVGAMRQYLDLPAAVRSGRGGVATDVQFTGARVDGVQADTRLDAVAVTLASDLPELRFDHLSGHLAFVRTTQGFTLTAKQLVTRAPGETDANAARPADVEVSMNAAGGRANANVVNLGALAGLIESLPLPPELRDAVRVRTPEGVVQGLEATWTGPLQAPVKYSLSARVKDLSLRAQGQQPGVAHFSGAVRADQGGGTLAVDAQNFQLQLPTLFEQTLLLAGVQGSAHWTIHGAMIDCVLDRLHLDDPDLLGTLEGTLALHDGKAGQTRLHGTFDHVEVGAVGRFLPLVVGHDARNWLKDALQGGVARQVTLRLEGDLQQFPFAHPGSGVFHVQVPLEGGRLNFAPGWPALTGIRGVLDFEGPGLRVQAQEAHQGTLLARAVEGGIADLAADHPLLTLHGTVSGPLQSGLQFILDSPLRGPLGSFAGAVRASGEGNLVLGLQVPLDNTDRTKVDGLLSVEQGELRDPAHIVPPLQAIATRLHFTEHEASAPQMQARILGGLARGSLHTDVHGDVMLEAQGRADLRDVAEFYGEGNLGFLQGQGEWSGKFHLGSNTTDVDVQARLPVFGYPADLVVTKHGSGPLDVQASGHAPLPALLQTWVPTLAPLAEGEVRWSGGLHRTATSDELSGSGQFTLLGRPGEFVLAGHPGAAILDLSGGIDTRVLTRILPDAVAPLLDGTTSWKARYDERPGQTLARFTSDLRGVRIAIPAPLGKSASESAALRLQLQRVRNGGLVLVGGIERQIGVAALLPATTNDRLRRIGVRFGGAASVPSTDGVQISGELASVDLDAWQAALVGNAPRGRPPLTDPSIGTDAAPAPAGGLPVSADLHLGVLSTGHYRFDHPVVQAHTIPSGWHLDVKGPDLEGQADWSTAGTGHLQARLDHLRLVGSGDKAVPPSPTAATTLRNISRLHLTELKR